MNWDEYFMSMAFFVAMKSKDPSTKIGAVIVGQDNEIRSTGFNGLPRGVTEESERLIRPEKYLWYEHGERNAIYNAARMGMVTRGCKMYTQGIPCTDCARGIIQSGISEVVIWNPWDDNPNGREKWVEAAKRSTVMFQEGGVILRPYSGPLICEIKGFRNEVSFDIKAAGGGI